MSDTERKLIEIVIHDLMMELADEETAHSVRQMAYNKVFAGDDFQIQIIVTRHEADFLEPMQTEIVEAFNHEG